jgi:hypothetical protein
MAPWVVELYSDGITFLGNSHNIIFVRKPKVIENMHSYNGDTFAEIHINNCILAGVSSSTQARLEICTKIVGGRFEHWSHKRAWICKIARIRIC